jgi:peptide/nickel transport system substrate-binding protein
MSWSRVVLIIGLALSSGCVAPTTGGGSTGSGPAPAAESRTLVAAVRLEASSVARALGEAGGVGTQFQKTLVNAELALLDADALPQPYLAERLPQLNSNDWKVGPDGRMETTYRLKPDLVWHDGVPLNAEDFVFAWRVYLWPELAANGTLTSIIEDVSAPDSRTIVVRWLKPHVDAGSLTGAEMPALPMHILGQKYDERNAEAFLSSPFWQREYVGLGPYKVTRWEPAAFFEMSAFDQFVFGRPRIDRIRLLVIPDNNTVMANMLSGEVHLAADGSLRAGQVPTVLEQWGGKGTAFLHPNQWRAIIFQLRPEFASPRALLDVRVRKALAHGVDKAAVNDAAYEGQYVPADTMVPPTGQTGRAVDSGIAKYPYDPRQSEALMQTAGFSRGADGTFASLSDGRFVSELKTNAAADSEAEVAIIAAGYRQIGFDMQQASLPAAQAQDNEARATFSGLYSFSSGIGESQTVNYTSSRIGRPDNRWQGGNRGGWSSVEFDRLSDTFLTTLDRDERTRLLTQMLRIFAEDVPAIPLFYRAQPWVFVNDLKGPRLVPAETNVAWDVQQWEFK